MKLRVTTYEFDGSPEELDRAGLVQLLGLPEPSEPSAGASGEQSGVIELPEAVQEFIRIRVPPSTQRIVREFISDVLSWTGVRAAAGSGVRGGRYIRLHRRG